MTHALVRSCIHTILLLLLIPASQVGHAPGQVAALGGAHSKHRVSYSAIARLVSIDAGHGQQLTYLLGRYSLRCQSELSEFKNRLRASYRVISYGVGHASIRESKPPPKQMPIWKISLSRRRHLKPRPPDPHRAGLTMGGCRWLGPKAGKVRCYCSSCYAAKRSEGHINKHAQALRGVIGCT